MVSMIMEQKGLQVINSGVGMIHWMKEGFPIVK
jgi:hypothetical protein